MTNEMKSEIAENKNMREKIDIRNKSQERPSEQFIFSLNRIARTKTNKIDTRSPYVYMTMA